MTKWEYKRAYLYNTAKFKSLTRPLDISTLCPSEDRDAYLNEHGAEGWELVCYEAGPESTLVIFKRPLAMLEDNDYIALYEP